MKACVIDIFCDTSLQFKHLNTFLIYKEENGVWTKQTNVFCIVQIIILIKMKYQRTLLTKCVPLNFFEHIHRETQLFKLYLYETVFFRHYFVSLYGKVKKKRKGKKIPLQKKMKNI